MGIAQIDRRRGELQIRFMKRGGRSTAPDAVVGGTQARRAVYAAGLLKYPLKATRRTKCC